MDTHVHLAGQLTLHVLHKPWMFLELVVKTGEVTVAFDGFEMCFVAR